MTDRILRQSAHRRMHVVAQRLFPGVGCGDSGCIFGSPGGMSTNGGCRCTSPYEHTPIELGTQTRRLAAIAMELAREVVELEAQR